MGSRIVTALGQIIVRVVEVRATRLPPDRVIALHCGPHAWLDRLHLATSGLLGHTWEPHRIPWEAVDRIEGTAIHLKPEHEAASRRTTTTSS